MMRHLLESNGVRVRRWTRVDNRGTRWEHPDSRPGKFDGEEPTITAVIVGGPNSDNVEGVFWVPLHEIRPFMDSGKIVVGQYLGQLHAALAPPECPSSLVGRVLTATDWALCRELTAAFHAARRRVDRTKEVHRCLQLLRRTELLAGDGCTESIRDRRTAKCRSRWSDSREDMILALLVDLGAGYDWPAANEAAARTAKRLDQRLARTHVTA